MFDLFKKKKNTEYLIGSPVKGKSIPINEVNDPTFAEELVGKGAAVIPEEGKIYAPCDGEITMLFETLHAVCIQTEYGAEVLIHIGLDTVTMKGDGFISHVKVNDQVKKGDLLIEVDLEKVKAAGYEIVTPVVICNPAQFNEIKTLKLNEIQVGEDLISITVK